MLVVVFGIEAELQASGIEIPLLAEPQREESGAGADRRHEEIEGGGRRVLAAAFLGLICGNGETLVQGIDRDSTGKRDFHRHEISSFLCE